MTGSDQRPAVDAPASREAVPGAAFGPDHRLVLPKVEGALFDLDGVIATTAALHEMAWTKAFAPVLDGFGAAPFTSEDYRAHVDGRRREDGIATFLTARGLPHDGALIADIAGKKNALFLSLLQTVGPQAMPGARHLLATLREHGVRIGLFTASRNAKAVLGALGLLEAFDARIDGHTAERDGLCGKPSPDMPLACAKALAVLPQQCALFEDAVPGVEAGRAGHFALVVGLGEGAHGANLLAHGAHHIVPALDAVAVAGEP